MNNPTPVIIIIAVLSCTLAAISLAIRSNRKKNELRELQNAARKLVKEQKLNDSLLDHHSRRDGEKVRMIIALSWKEKEKESYVFDPADGVRIGRQPDANNIVLPDDEVSMQHCLLHRRGKALVLQDLHSTNGTMVVHGLQRRWVRGGVYVYDGDKIRVGRTQMLLHVFWIDTAYL